MYPAPVVDNTVNVPVDLYLSRITVGWIPGSRGRDIETCFGSCLSRQIHEAKAKKACIFDVDTSK